MVLCVITVVPWVLAQEFTTVLSHTVEDEEPHGGTEGFRQEVVTGPREMGVEAVAAKVRASCHGGSRIEDMP